MTSWLVRLGAAGRTPVFAVRGIGARETVQDLALRRGIRLLDTPRAASILLVAGTVPDAMADAVARVHDAIPHPRATLLIPGARLPAGLAARLPDVVTVTGEPEAAVVKTYRDLLAGRRRSESALLPDVDPAPWRGVGPYGQGGSGMTGGVPYGRPMAELAPDPDGLRLDALTVAVGPLFARFPTGLVVDVRWAGDLVLDASVTNQLTAVDAAVRPGLAPFVRALGEPVPIRELELARGRDHLRSIADTLLAHGLPALAVRALRLATTLRPEDAPDVRRLGRLIAASQLYRWSVPRTTTFERDRLAGLGLGPVGRAAGVAEDLRTGDAAYRELGFETLIAERGDAGSRLRLRLAETVQSLDLAARAEDRVTTPTGRVESPRGRLEHGSAPGDRLLPLLPDAIREIEWGDAVATIVSLDLDLEESAVVRAAGAEDAAA